jgi:hypothetical protein
MLRHGQRERAKKLRNEQKHLAQRRGLERVAWSGYLTLFLSPVTKVYHPIVEAAFVQQFKL